MDGRIPEGELAGLALLGEAGFTRRANAQADAEAVARSVVEDAEQLAAAYRYWATAFEAIGEDAFGDGDAPGLRLAQATPGSLPQLARNDLVAVTAELREKMAANLRQRDEGRSADGIVYNAMVQSPCVASAANIAKEVLCPPTGKTAKPKAESPTVLLDRLKAFKTEAARRQGLAQQQGRKATGFSVLEIAQGIRATRELYDTARRFRYCTWNRQEFDIPFSELQALYMQEGALVVTPPRDSFRHAPLIATVTGSDCRSEAVSFTTDWGGTARRPGFNLVFTLSPEAAGQDRDMRLQAVQTNLLVLGGLDNIVYSRLLGCEGNGGPVDELIALLSWAYGPTLAPLRIGMTMAHIEQQADPMPWQRLLDSVDSELEGLIATHTVGRLPNDPSLGYIEGKSLRGVESAIEPDDVLACLRVQARWYASRRWPRTLLAHCHRIYPALAKLPRFSPFVTYIRFHVQDSVFMYILMSAVICLGQLEQWHNRHRTAHSSPVLQALRASAYQRQRAAYDKLVDALVPERDSWRRYLDEIWRRRGRARAARAARAASPAARLRILQGPRPFVPEDLWRHVGLMAWLGTSLIEPIEPSARQSENARIAFKVIQAINDLELLDPICKALEFTPLHALVSVGVMGVPATGDYVNAAEILAKAHSFERLRLTYARAVAEAGLTAMDAQ